MPISPYIQDLRERVGQGLLLLPGVTAVVFDDAGRVLLNERSDNGEWALIAGVMDPGEQPAETIVREVYEETAVHVVPERVLALPARLERHPPVREVNELAQHVKVVREPAGVVVNVVAERSRHPHPPLPEVSPCAAPPRSAGGPLRPTR